MIKRSGITLLLVVLSAIAISAQGSDDQVRLATREKLRALLNTKGPGISVTFKQSDKQPFNYVGSLKSGLVNAESFEIVISVTTKNTIGFRIFPHYRGSYINIDKVKNNEGLMRLLLRLCDRAFLYWGIDETGDVFTGYTFTLESGFPDDAIGIVLQSIRHSDDFVGEMRPFIDGSSSPASK
jgi:hypothetical protein